MAEREREGVRERERERIERGADERPCRRAPSGGWDE
jgi:hypothetical protein